MSCPFITNEKNAYCEAEQTTSIPGEKGAVQTCTYEAAKNYRLCRRYRRAVWSGVIPTFQAPPEKCDE